LHFLIGSVGPSPWSNLLDKGVSTFYELGLNYSDLIRPDCSKDDQHYDAQNKENEKNRF